MSHHPSTAGGDAGAPRSADRRPDRRVSHGSGIRRRRHGSADARPIAAETAGERKPKPTFFDLATTWYASLEPDKLEKEFERWLAVQLGNYKPVAVEGQDRWGLHDLAAEPAEQSPVGPDYEYESVETRSLLSAYRSETEKLSRR